MKASSIDIRSCSKMSKSEVFDDDTSSFKSSSDDEDEDESDYSLAESYDAEVAIEHDNELRFSDSDDQDNEGNKRNADRKDMRSDSSCSRKSPTKSMSNSEIIQ